MVVIHRSLSHGAEERDWSLSGRVHVSGKEGSDCRAAHGAGVETVEHCAAVFKVTLYSEGTSGHDGCNNRLSGSLQGFQEIALGAYEIEVGQGMSLSGKDGFLSKEGKDYIGPSCGSNDIGEIVALLAAVRKAGDIGDFTRETLLKSLQRGYGMGFFAVKHPGA